MSATAPAASWPRRFVELTKARLSSLVLLTTAVGFVHGADTASGLGSSTLLLALVGTLLGTGLVAGAANAFNEIMERGRDRLMHRTQQRPLVNGEMTPRMACITAVVLTVVGTTLLATLANTAAAALALLTLLIYVLVYTPLKVRTTLNTLVGAICGALPPMIGWVGAAGSLDAGAWMLGALLFTWQIPHFLALAWLYREDYARGHFAMLPARDASGQLTCQIMILTSLMLVPLALSATLLGLAGWLYAAGSTLLGLWLLARAVRLYRERTNGNARSVFLASLVYLSAVLMLLLVDRGPVNTGVTVHQLARTAEIPAVLE
ncbi:MAG: protoheme IX farnesyltransferase [Planctomycetes bacterium]|nr:protoheme IX farnesyltransferase [Planctomycetota bacterium]